MALYSYINKTWLSVDGNNIPNAKVETAGPAEDWVLIEVDKQANVYALKSHRGMFLMAVPPVDEQPSVFADANQMDDSVMWTIEPTNRPPPRVPK